MYLDVPYSSPALIPGHPVPIRIIRFALGYASGSMTIRSSNVKIAVEAPRPNASVNIAKSENERARPSDRSAWPNSRNSVRASSPKAALRRDAPSMVRSSRR